MVQLMSAPKMPCKTRKIQHHAEGMDPIVAIGCVCAGLCNGFLCKSRFSSRSLHALYLGVVENVQQVKRQLCCRFLMLLLVLYHKRSKYSHITSCLLTSCASKSSLHTSGGLQARDQNLQCAHACSWRSIVEVFIQILYRNQLSRLFVTAFKSVISTQFML